MINQKEFTAVVLDPGEEAFIMHVPYIGSKIIIFLVQEAQITLLINEEVVIPDEYFDYVNVFLEKSVAKLPKCSNINKHAIELEPGKQPFYKPIYSLGTLEFETLKTYIDTNLVNSFICPFKSPTGAPILFIKKPDGNLCLYINYQSLNYLTIKNRYLLPLIGKLLDWLG